MITVNKAKTTSANMLQGAMAANATEEEIRKCRRVDKVAQNMGEAFEELYAKLNNRVNSLRIESEAATSLLQAEAQEQSNSTNLASVMLGSSIQQMANTTDPKVMELFKDFMNEQEKKME